LKHVLGMAKRHIDLNGAKGPKLELDYLRLVYAVGRLRTSSQRAQGYLVVLTPEIRATTSRWRTKYEAGESVTVLVAPLTAGEGAAIKLEVAANTKGMIAGSTGAAVSGRSSAEAGGAIVEDHLVNLIAANEPGVVRITERRLFPLSINWDYYGHVHSG
jgi:hypothetical protein